MDINVFYDQLADHGTWVEHPDYRYVFVPSDVGLGWRPYQEDVGSGPMPMAGTGIPTNRSAGQPIITAAGAMIRPMAGSGFQATPGRRPG